LLVLSLIQGNNPVLRYRPNPLSGFIFLRALLN
jgi:hypothetical protein